MKVLRIMINLYYEIHDPKTWLKKLVNINTDMIWYNA